jgi:hypothetical protein
VLLSCYLSLCCAHPSIPFSCLLLSPPSCSSPISFRRTLPHPSPPTLTSFLSSTTTHNNPTTFIFRHREIRPFRVRCITRFPLLASAVASVQLSRAQIAVFGACRVAFPLRFLHPSVELPPAVFPPREAIPTTSSDQHPDPHRTP